MSKIYFPLRTNVHYWDLNRLDLSLESRIKLSALLYEDLIFEDGSYTAIIGPKMSVEFRGPENLSEDELPRTGGDFSFKFNDVMFESPAQRRYQLNFRKMLEKIGLISETWVNFTSVEFSEEGKNKLKLSTEKSIKSFYDGNKETYFLQAHILTWTSQNQKGLT